MAQPVGQWRSRIDPYLATWNLPRPIKLVIAAMLWPIFGVMLLLSGAFGLLTVLFVGAIVLALVYVLGAGGVQGFGYLAAHPLSVVPHSAMTGIALLVAVPLSVWWIHDIVRVWRTEDERRQRERNLSFLRGVASGAWTPPPGFEGDLSRARAARFMEESEHEPAPPPDVPGRLSRSVRGGRNGLAVAAWLVVLWTLGVSLHQVAANDPSAGALVAALVAFLGGLAYLRLTYGGKEDRYVPVLAPVVTLLVALVIGVYAGISERSGGTLRNYCEYGAVSNAQLAGCLDHVTDSQINGLQTDAARFARGYLSQCLSDAGPFCAGRLASMQQAQNAPDGQ
jgi:hypothetical protein